GTEETLMAAWSLKARLVFPVSWPPLREGIVTVDEGRIVAVESDGTRKADVELGDVAVLPGLVNAHTHLDLSGMRGLAPPSSDFTGWLQQVIAHRGQRLAAEVAGDIRLGLAECVGFGTTLIGDISADGSSWSELEGAPLRTV